uniref:Uncharacterized protein n=1 Tax=Trichuris muris TaxID=70415 RepID=A0A5S6QJR5_TRIMR
MRGDAAPKDPALKDATLILLATTATSIFILLLISLATSSCRTVGQRIRTPRSGISDQLLAHHSADQKLLETVQKNFAYGLALWNSTEPRRKPSWSGRSSQSESVLKYLGALLEN